MSHFAPRESRGWKISVLTLAEEPWGAEGARAGKLALQASPGLSPIIRSLDFWVVRGELLVPSVWAARCRSRETEHLLGTQGSVFPSEGIPVFVIWF